MKKISHTLAALCVVCALPAGAQNSGSKALTVDDLAAWKRISQQAISNNGQWTACKMEPWQGDASVELISSKGKTIATFTPADKFDFAAQSDYLVVQLTTAKATLDSLKLKKVKKDKFPMDRLVLCTTDGQKETIDSLKSYKLSEASNWLAYQRGRKDSTLYIRTLDGKKSLKFPAVTAFAFARKGEALYYVVAPNKEQVKPGLYTLLTSDGTSRLIKEGDGRFHQETLSATGQHMAFLYQEKNDSTDQATTLWLSDKQAPARLIAQYGNAAFPEKWIISKNGRMQFNKAEDRLFFGTAPKPLEKDSTLLDENRPNVQVWSWDEPVQYTVQDFQKKEEAKRSYSAVYNLSNGKLLQLADKELPNGRVARDAEGDYLLVSTSRPYSLSSMWEGRTKSDVFAVSLNDGTRRAIAKADYTDYSLSPAGKYAYGYNETDSCYYCVNLSTGNKVRLTTPQSFPAWDEENDVPNYPNAHGVAGWTEGDQSLLIYDRYDIWAFNPQETSAPVNLTANGRSAKIRYRLVKLNKEAKSIDTNQPQLILGFNEATKGYGYYSATLSKKRAPKELLAGDYMLRTIVKAKDADKVIYTLENFTRFPDLYYSDLSFKNSQQLTHGIDQQNGYLWGTAELVHWTSLTGTALDGVLYKPTNFDPKKKYPMIVNFYERNSETLNNYRMPEPHRSTIDYHYYLSNGYLVFNPDVRYRDGYPGESCYNCVMPGIFKLIEQGFVNEKAIGAQGHSWGGYQVAYLATRTSLFAAIESGAPVVNMFSAYGGIRWGSGLARSFQYEHTQSRLAGTPWNAPMRYFENSSLFTMDKVTTPILIMHNDADGHVPWYQGIEYFVAMKRLGKPCWLLNYTGEPHWPMKTPNKIDFQKRMSQFFDHFLKGAPEPEWMKDGVPAVDQPHKLGY